MEFLFLCWKKQTNRKEFVVRSALTDGIECAMTTTDCVQISNTTRTSFILENDKDRKKPAATKNL